MLEMQGYEQDWSGSEYKQVVDSCKHGNKRFQMYGISSPAEDLLGRGAKVFPKM